MDLLKKLCEIHAPSGNEIKMKEFILHHVGENMARWSSQPEIIHGPEFQDCLILAFGKPRTAVFAHMDSIGFTVRYQNQLVPIGGPDAHSGYKLVGADSLGPIECELEVNKDHQLFYNFGRAIDTGTDLVFKCDFKATKTYVTSCYLDNRLGVYNALRLAETLDNGVLVFSCWEEHGGGAVPYLIRYIYERWQIKNALISDITWVTDGVQPGKGVVISMRDRNIPRKSYINKIIDIAQKHQIDYQLEVEGSGSSDGRELQTSPYPMDWCFIGAPEENVHSPQEKVHKYDIECMLELYRVLMKTL
ncbi:Cellulase M [Fulvivirga imtechensis AK7]|uniref:Cellulase M n=1 Tax=Fulvivirga imtechensis AK7 TaxID=1237149 RepID=L8JQ32_9BACT|nr:M20/M25/M40 family metallo-hydrolase [Fulvivirga imtechensis]ELR70955.1 Cellulase M [Fulvivirga imtechensis AK7]